MAKNKRKWVVTRLLDETHMRIKVRAAKDRKKIWEIADEMSKQLS